MAQKDRSISLGKAAKKYGIPVTTLAHWVERGLLTVLQKPERRGQPLLVDETSVIVARESYTPYWRAGKERQFTMPPWPTNVPPGTASQERSELEVIPTIPEPAAEPVLKTKELFDAFQAYNAMLSPRTIERYRSYLTPFVRDFEELPLAPEIITQWIASDKVGQYHRFNRFRDLRVFYRWLEREKGITNPMSRVRTPKKPNTLPRYLSDDELRDLLNHKMDVQDKIILETLITTGVRAGELCSITVDDIHADYLLIRGKVGERSVNLIPSVCESLTKLAKKAGKDGRIFKDRDGKALTAKVCTNRVRRVMQRAGITGAKTGPHTLRHTFGHIVQRESGDLVALQAMLGHTQISTTRIYAQLSQEDVKRKYDEFAPHNVLDHFKGGAEDGKDS